MSFRTGVAAVCSLLAASTGLGVPNAAADQQQPAGPSGPAPPQSRPQSQFPETYGPLAAGAEAHQQAEQHRRMAIERQLGLIAEMRWHSGLVGVSAYYPYPPSLEAIYAQGGRRAVRATRKYWRRHPYYVYPPVFTPWPLVPGDIYGYPYAARVEQPSGHMVIRTGPNGAIYRPVYEWDLRPKQSPTLVQPRVDPSRASGGRPTVEVLPDVFSRPPDRPEPAAEIIPAPPAEEGPREF